MTDLFSASRAALEADRARLQQALAVVETALAAIGPIPEASVVLATLARQPFVLVDELQLPKPLGARLPRPKKARRAPAPAVDSAGRERPANIVAREAALLAQVRKGPQGFAALLDAMPQEPDMGEVERRSACSNALFRMKTRKLIAQDQGGRYVIA